MDFRKSKILLEKIVTLHNNMAADPDNVNAIEVDLLKSYLRQFYELLHLGNPAADSHPAEEVVEIIKARPEAQPITPPPLPRDTAKQSTPATADIKASPTPPPPPAEKPASKPQIKVPIVTEDEEEEGPVPTDLEALFTFESARELSEKLSQMPISDIRKAMGLNDRILTVNELFDGDQAAFDATVATLNQLKSFDEARRYLIDNVALKYDWLSKEKVKKARHFIKLIKRRYN